MDEPSMPARAAQGRGSSWSLPLALLGAATAVRLLLGAVLPLFEDEAYYWVWSQRLAFGYFDHPPGIAVLIRAGALVLGSSPFGVRVVPILAGSGAALATMLLAGRLANTAAATSAALVFAVMPLAAAGLVLATPDAPLLAAVAWALYAVVRAVEAPPSSRASLGWWLAAGCIIGVGLTVKYTAVLVPAAVGLAVVAHPDLRRRLAEPGPWLALLAAALVFTPVIVWNARHEWVSFAFQLQHGLGPRRDGVLAAAERVAELLAGQAALASPILFVLMAIVVARALRPSGDPVRFVLAVLALAPLVLFGYSATQRPVEANWPALIYLPAGVLLVTAPATTFGARAFRWGVGLAAAMSAVIYVHAIAPIVPLRPDRDPIASAFGWDALADSAIVAAPSPTCSFNGRRTWFAGNRYQDAAQLAVQLAQREKRHCMPVFALNVMSRPNQFDLWPGVEDALRPGDDLVVALSGQPSDSAIAAVIGESFATARPAMWVSLARSGVEHDRRRVWVFETWRGR